MHASHMQLAERMKSSIVTINIRHEVENITIFKGAIKINSESGVGGGMFDNIEVSIL